MRTGEDRVWNSTRWRTSETFVKGLEPLRSLSSHGFKPRDDTRPRVSPKRLHAKQSVEDSTAGLGPTLRTGRAPVGGLSFHGVSGLCANSLACWQPGGIQAQDMGRRPMQAWVTCFGGRTHACDPRVWVALSVVGSADPTLKKQNKTSARKQGCRKASRPSCDRREVAQLSPPVWFGSRAASAAQASPTLQKMEADNVPWRRGPEGGRRRLWHRTHRRSPTTKELHWNEARSQLWP